MGFSYQIEFVGEKVKGDVGQLEFLVGDAASGCTALSSNVQYDIETTLPGAKNREIQQYNITANDPTGADRKSVV